MIIDPKLFRDVYFEPWEPRRIFSRFAHLGDDENFTRRRLQALQEDGKVVVGSVSGDLEELLAGEARVDHERTLEVLDQVGDDQLLILPQAYDIEGSDGQRLRAHSTAAFVSLSSKAARSHFFSGTDVPEYFSRDVRSQGRHDPHDFLAFALEQWKEHHGLDAPLLGYFWYGAGGSRTRRVVSFMEAIDGAELRAMQNLAFYKVGLPKLHELAKEAQGPTKTTLLKNIDRHERYIAAHYGDGFLDRLDVDESFLIEPEGGYFANGLGIVMRTVSRSRPGQTHRFMLQNLPQGGKSPRAYALVWDVAGRVNSENVLYGSHRRGAGDAVVDEIVFSAHAIAAYQTLVKMTNGKKRRRGRRSLDGIELSPFVMPKKDTVRVANRLRYGTLLGGSEGVRRPLNKATVGRLLGMWTLAQGYDASWTMRRSDFVHDRYDPQPDLVTLL